MRWNILFKTDRYSTPIIYQQILINKCFCVHTHSLNANFLKTRVNDLITRDVYIKKTYFVTI